MALSDRERRIGTNEALFRQVNERLEELNRAFEDVTETMEIVCECGDIACTEAIRIAPDDYERLRGDPALFAVVEGHAAAGIEEVVERHDGYNVLRKAAGEPSRLAEETAPRS